ncbi:unnamed protein product [Lasius platythorax]|uniref:Uncharacterized protein n=1 Tax=Lasius platythorax TaxID=488582 RepID=A0AAV2PAL6_9HYME
MHGRSTKTECVEKVGHTATMEHQKRQSWRRCNSQEGSEAERLSGEVACCSNDRRETGGIKLLQTITFNEKVNAAPAEGWRERGCKCADAE